MDQTRTKLERFNYCRRGVEERDNPVKEGTNKDREGDRNKIEAESPHNHTIKKDEFKEKKLPSFYYSLLSCICFQLHDSISPEF